jgi:hypothetical protein
MTISNPDLLSSSETGVNPEKLKNSIYLNQLDVRKGIGGIHITKKRRAETLRHVLVCDNFKSRLEGCIFKRIS